MNEERSFIQKENRVAFVHQGCKSRHFASLWFWTNAHLEYDRVNVLAKQVEEEPVPHVALPDDRVYAFFFYTPAMSQIIFGWTKSDRVSLPVPKTKHKCPNVRAEDDDNAVDDDQAGEEPQEEKPEPDEDVDLFVDCNRMGLLSRQVQVEWWWCRSHPQIEEMRLGWHRKQCSSTEIENNHCFRKLNVIKNCSKRLKILFFSKLMNDGAWVQMDWCKGEYRDQDVLTPRRCRSRINL